jgi:hypothetical protein
MAGRRLVVPLAAAAALALASSASAAPVLGWVAASLREVSGRYYVDAPDDPYVVEIASAPDVNGDGSFVAANVVDALSGLHASGIVLDWKADRLLPAGTYFVHGGDVSAAGVVWSDVTSFMVVTPCVIPDVRGRTIADARAALSARGCGVGAITTVKSTRRAGRVVRTDPPIGTPVPPQTRVRLYVSAGPRRHART